MNNNCNKYQSLYVFRTEEELQEHLDVCAICRKQHSEIIEVEKLVKFSKTAYLKNKFKTNTVRLNRAIAGVAVLIFTSFIFNNYSELNSINTHLKHPEVSEFTNNSLFNQMQLPTDDYGILDPHKELNYD